MRKFYLNKLSPDYRENIAAILGEDWEDRVVLDKHLHPYAGVDFRYYRALTGGTLFCRLIERDKGVSVLEVYESELEFEVLSCPVKYEADYREQFAYRPDEDELHLQFEVILDFWRSGLKLDLEKPITFSHHSLGGRCDVVFTGFDIRPHETSDTLCPLMLFRDWEAPSGEIRIGLSSFAGDWSNIIPEQLPAKQLSLFG